MPTRNDVGVTGRRQAPADRGTDQSGVPREVPAITDALELLTRDHELRTRMADAARSLAQGEHQLDRVAEAYVAALEEAAGGAVVQDAVFAEIARAAQETGLPANGNALSDIAERLREVGPGR